MHEGPSFSAPSAEGLLARSRADGEPLGRPVRFPSRVAGEVHAFQRGDRTFVLESPYTDQTHLMLSARRRDGSLDLRFGLSGRVRIRAPWRGSTAALETSVLGLSADRGTIVLVATLGGRRELQVIRLRL